MTQPQPMDGGRLNAGGQSCVIRTARKEDLEDIVTIHQKAFLNSFLTHMGRGFLDRYYALVLNYQKSIFLVKEGYGRVEGFVCGFADPEGFYRLMSQRRSSFARPILLAVIRRPCLTGRIVFGIQRVEQETAGAHTRSCELSSLAVHPELRGRGTGRTLVKDFLERASCLGIRHVFLRTDTADNQAANSLYHKAGFHLDRRYRQYKERWMSEYVIDLQSGDA